MPPRWILTVVQHLRRAYWFVARPRTTGVRAVVFDAAGRLVLVRHAYEAGFYLPGGGVKRGESHEAAALRELREELGLEAWDEIAPFATYESRREFKRDTVHLFVLRGAVFRPVANWEIAAIEAFAPDQLPDSLTPATRRRLAEVAGDAAVAGGW